MAGEQGSGGAITVRVRAYAMLRRYLPELPLGHPAEVHLGSGATIGDALARLGIPLSETKTCFVNGIQRALDYPLKEGDEVALFPPVAGGGPVSARFPATHSGDT